MLAVEPGIILTKSHRLKEYSNSYRIDRNFVSFPFFIFWQKKSELLNTHTLIKIAARKKATAKSGFIYQ